MNENNTTIHPNLNIHFSITPSIVHLPISVQPNLILFMIIYVAVVVFAVACSDSPCFDSISHDAIFVCSLCRDSQAEKARALTGKCE